MAKKQSLILTLVAFLVVAAWIISSIITSRAKVVVEPSLQEALDPINQTFDSPSLDLISRIPTLNPTPIPSVFPIPLPSPTPSITPVATRSASQSANQ